MSLDFASCVYGANRLNVDKKPTPCYVDVIVKTQRPQKRAKRKEIGATRPIRSHNPRWDPPQTFHFPVDAEDIPFTTIKFTVWSRNVLRRDILIGHVTLELYLFVQQTGPLSVPKTYPLKPPLKLRELADTGSLEISLSKSEPAQTQPSQNL